MEATNCERGIRFDVSVNGIPLIICFVVSSSHILDILEYRLLICGSVCLGMSMW